MTNLLPSNLVVTIGSQSDDVLVPPFGFDAYGLAGNDVLISSAFSGNGLVGGSGDDLYQLGFGSVTTILENGNSTADVLVSPITGPAIDAAVQIDGRHLLVSDFDSGTTLLVIDWQKPENIIEVWVSDEGVFTFDEFRSALFASDVFLGDSTIEELGIDPAFRQLIATLDAAASACCPSCAGEPSSARRSSTTP